MLATRFSEEFINRRMSNFIAVICERDFMVLPYIWPTMVITYNNKHYRSREVAAGSISYANTKAIFKNNIIVAILQLIKRMQNFSLI